MSSLTTRQGIVNLCNTSIGLGVLAKPFALGVSGWTGIIAFGFAAFLMIYVGLLISWSTSKLLKIDNTNLNKIIQPTKPLNTATQRGYNSISVDINDEKNASNESNKEDKKIKSQTSKPSKSAFQLISYRALGRYGGIVGITSFFIIFLSMMLSICVMVWELIIDILVQFKIDSINYDLLYLFTFILYIISSFILNWKQMTFISYIGVIAIFAVFVTSIGICIDSLITYNLSPPPMDELIIKQNINFNDVNTTNIALNARVGMTEIERLIFVFVLFIFGVSANGAVPSITMNLEDPSKITMIVVTSYILVACFNISIGSIGYWLYGEYVDVMILNNFYLWPSGYIVLIVTILVILNLWASFSISLTLIGEIMDERMKLNHNQKGYRRTVRFSLSAMIFVLSYLLRKHLAFIVAFSSAICTLCSVALTLPITIYICTFWKEISVFNKIFHFILLAICTCFGILDAYIDFANVL